LGPQWGDPWKSGIGANRQQKRGIRKTEFKKADRFGSALPRGQIANSLRKITKTGCLCQEFWILGPGCGLQTTLPSDAIRNRFRDAGRVLAFGLDTNDLAALSWLPVTVTPGEHLSAGLEAFGRESRLAGIGPADVHLREPRNVPRVTGGARGYGNGVLAENATAVFCQLVPWEFDGSHSMNLKRTERRMNFLLSRLLSNLGVASTTPLLERFVTPVDTAREEPRWRQGLYLDAPEEWDDPYRFFRW
jgi:hypothetical protein